MENKQINFSEKDVLEFQLNKQTAELYKKFLEILEDIQASHKASINNLRKALVLNQDRLRKHHDVEVFLEPLAQQANFFDQKQYEQYRKRVLDKGNDCLRGLSEELNKYNIKVKG